MAVENGNDLSHLVQLWSMFVALSLDESTAHFRKNTLMQLMQIMHLKVPIYEQQFFKNFLIPCLNLEAAILETEKVSWPGVKCLTTLFTKLLKLSYGSLLSQIWHELLSS